MARKRTKTKVVLVKNKPKTKTTEMTRLGGLLRTLGGLGGGAIGALVGHQNLGSATGTSLGASISKWLGSGDYTVNSNSIVKSVKASGAIPDMHKADQSITVRHKEFICEVVSNTAFTVQRSFQINPGLPLTFPWLSRIASNYQQYRVKGMVFHYVPTSGNAVSSTNNALGSVMLQTSYRSNDSLPLNKVEVLNEFWSSEAVPSEPFCHPIECNPNENPFNVQYVRSGPPPVGDNQLLYDLGTTHLCVSGQQASNIVLGDLWVTYEIELKKPIIDSNVTASDTYLSQFYFTGPVPASLFGTATTTTVGNVPLGLAANVITIPVGYSGRFSFVISFYNATSFTGVVMTGPATVTNGTLATYNELSPIPRIEAAGSAGAVQNYATYAFVFLKANRDAASTITLPTASIAAGTLGNLSLTMWGTTDLQ